VITLARARILESHGPAAVVDLPGLALVTGAASGIVWGLVRGNQAGWGSAEVVSALVAGALLTAGFAAWELRARAPMLPMRLFRSRAFSADNAAMFFRWASALKYGDRLALPNARYELGIPPPFGPGARQGPRSMWLWSPRTSGSNHYLIVRVPRSPSGPSRTLKR
jgi:hypothetical protein